MSPDPALSEQRRAAALATSRATDARVLAATAELQPDVALPTFASATKHALATDAEREEPALPTPCT